MDHDFRRIFWDQVDLSNWDGCWLWEGPLDKAGHGVLYLPARIRKERSTTDTQMLAHQIVWELETEQGIGEWDVLHLCETSACVNPGHLFLGKRVDNVQQEVSEEQEIARGKGLSDGEILQIRHIWQQSRDGPRPTQKEIAKLFGVSRKTINKIVNYHYRKHLNPYA